MALIDMVLILSWMIYPLFTCTPSYPGSTFLSYPYVFGDSIFKETTGAFQRNCSPTLQHLYLVPMISPRMKTFLDKKCAKEIANFLSSTSIENIHDIRDTSFTSSSSHDVPEVKCLEHLGLPLRFE
jgi:hypothetical protein